MNVKSVLYTLIWAGIACLLVWAGTEWINDTQEQAASTYDMTAYLWASTLVPIVYGLHLGLLDPPRAVKINAAVLVLVFLPSFIITVYPLSTLYVQFEGLNWLFQLSQQMNRAMLMFFGIVCGLSLVKSLTAQGKRASRAQAKEKTPWMN
ncbi:hypothetical protein ACE6ED_18720 [Paenibacillus sp. CN-4]|uniref:hypothetical protein n=1 Tax=Paenibacillus nanchangensis TaxID=3348343 RepID=UPI00397BE844